MSLHNDKDRRTDIGELIYERDRHIVSIYISNIRYIHAVGRTTNRPAW